ncbi:MAG: hypothetical protein RR620_13275 [Clostridium sp.]
MNFKEGIDLINHALFKIEREMLFNRWVSNYEQNGMSFETFESKIKQNIDKNKVSENNTLEILQDVKEILQLEF